MSVGHLSYAEASDQWVISAKPHVLMRMRRFFPQVSNAGQTLMIRHTAQVARDLEWFCLRYPLEMRDADRDRLHAAAAGARDLEALIDDIMAGRHERTGDMLTPARPPRAYQLKAADLALATGSLLVLHAVGLGKTYTSLLTLRDDVALPALVVTLGGRLPEQWIHQLELIFPEMLGHILPVGSMKDAQRRMANLDHQPDVLVVPYSRLSKYQDVLAGRVRTVIFDEIQELRHEGSAKYQAAQKVAGAADFVLGLTATPVYNYGGEMWNLCEILRPGALGSRQEFLREYGGHQYGSVAGNHVLDEMGALGEHMIEIGLMDRQTRASVGRELPEPERIEYEIDLDRAPLEAVADSVQALAARYLEEGQKGIDRMQTARDLDTMMRQATGLAKAPHVADLVALLLESEEKVLLYGWHHAVYRIWQHRLYDYRPVLYTGQQSTSQKRVAMENFLTGTSRVMMMSLRAGAGIDGLQDVCSVAVFGELDWSPGVHTQNIGRLARDLTDGRLKPETVAAYFCVCDEGSDPTMMDVLGLKQQQSDEMTDPDRELITPMLTDNRIERLARSVIGAQGSDMSVTS